MPTGKTYVRVADGLVYETVPPIFRENGDYVPIDERTVPSLLPFLIDVTDMSPQPEAWWTYVDGVFAPPAPPVVDYEAINRAQKNALMREASLAMTPVLMALQLGDDDDETTVAGRAWQAYYASLKAVDVTQESPAWPVAPT